MKFGPDGTGTNGPPVVYGPPSPTTGTTDGETAIVGAANAASFPETYALWIDEGMGWSASHTIQNIPALAAAYTASPGSTPGQLAVQVLGATPAQSTAIDKLDQANEASAGTSSGLMSDIFGDFFAVAYPFLMIGLGATFFLVFGFLAVKSITQAASSSGPGQSASVLSKFIK